MMNMMGAGMMERMGMGMPSMGTGTMGGMSGSMMPNMMMMPRCTMKMDKTANGMTITCTCEDQTACAMMQNLCTMMQGGMVSCCLMMNGMMVCCCNLTMGMTSCQTTGKGCTVTCTSGDQKCAQMVQSCCDCMAAMMKAGCSCCLMMNGMPVCCGTM